MVPFATLDDSTVGDRNFFVYTHALVLDDKDISSIVKVFYGSGNRKLKEKEEPLISFINENLPEEYELFACNHYMKYKTLWEELVIEAANDKERSGVVNEHFRHYAHRAANKSARKYYEKLSKRIGGVNNIPHEGNFVAKVRFELKGNRLFLPPLEDLIVYS